MFAYDCLLVLKSGTTHTGIKVWLLNKSNIPIFDMDISQTKETSYKQGE